MMRKDDIRVARLLLWGLRYAIQRALLLDCEWTLIKRKRDGYYAAQCRWCGAFKGGRRG